MKPGSERVHRKGDFQSYVLWKSLPSFLRGKPEAVIRKMGIEGEEILDLLKIKTQKEFCETYRIKDPGTLTDWNKIIAKEGLLKDVNSWARDLTPNVVIALYKNITKNGRAHEVRAWFELIEKE